MAISRPPKPFASDIDCEQPIAERFELCARLYAGRTALVSDVWSPTYHELDQAANRVAHAILSCPGAIGDRVALIARHDAPLVAGFLGVLKAGKCAVVLNPSDPLSCTVHRAQHAQATRIVADTAHLPIARNVAEAVGIDAHDVVRVNDYLRGESMAAPGVAVDPADMALIIYTSGSMGKPKGVVRSHRSILHIASRNATMLRITPSDRASLLGSLSTGNGISLTFAALLHGAALCPFPVMERGVVGMAEWIRAAEVTIYSSSSSLFRSFMRVDLDHQPLSSVRLVRLSAEPVDLVDVAVHRKRFPVGCRFIHTLASSETGLLACADVTEADFAAKGRVPVGAPISDDVEVLLLDDHGRAVAAGEVGEVTVRSRYLSSGYWRDPELTAEKFTFANGVGTYRSGDLAKLNPRGQLEFIGRKDARLKIRGYRIEPTEVEAALRSQPGVAEVVVGERSRDNGEPMLVAWVTRSGDHHASAGDLRKSLREILPDYAVPSEFNFLERLPVTVNGKIDRARLRGRVDRRVDTQPDSTSGPTTPTEITLARIWADVFQREAIRRDDDFYDLGGDSLMAAIVAAYVHAEFGVETPMSLFQRWPTLQAFAAAIDSGGRTRPFSPLPQADRCRPLPLSFGQELIWNVSQTPEGRAAYVMANTSLLRGDLDLSALRGSMAHLVDRHEILRTTFHTHEGVPAAIVHPSADVSLEVLDCSTHSDPEQAAREFFRERVRREPFDLGHLPLMRFWLIRLREREHWLMRAHHHILSDAWSWKIYFNELTRLYGAGLIATTRLLPPAPQYADYAVWQRETMAAGSRGFEDAIAWWTKRFANGPSALTLPFTRAKPCPDASPEDGVIRWCLPPDVSTRLNEVAARHKVTWLAVRLAVFVAALADANGQQDLVIGSYATGRTRLELQNMFGMFANMITLRFAWNRAWTFGRWLKEVSETITSAVEHSEIPYELLCRELTMGGTAVPEIRAIFSVSDHHHPRSFAGIEMTQVERAEQTMPWGFSMKLDQHNEHLCYTLFDARLYEPAGVRSFLARYRELLDVASSRPDLPLSQLLSIRGDRCHRAA